MQILYSYWTDSLDLRWFLIISNFDYLDISYKFIFFSDCTDGICKHIKGAWILMPMSIYLINHFIGLQDSST